MIDLAALKRAAEVQNTEKAVVTRRWLRAVHDELVAARAARPPANDEAATTAA